VSDWNDKVIEEFRSNKGHVGGGFAGAPLLLLHHCGRKSGKEYVAPMTYQAGPGDTVYVFASKGGSPDNPQWYANALAARKAHVELGTQAFDVTVEEVTGEERDKVYSRQAAAFPGFGDYEQKTRGTRIIPVLALTRTA
jgi:deazaflavin-dependent oxidoreductase (nitroreductase family)